MLKSSSDSNRIDDIMYRQKLQSVKVLQTPNAGRLIARWLMGLLITFIIILFLPWQQNITGTGSITAL